MLPLFFRSRQLLAFLLLVAVFAATADLSKSRGLDENIRMTDGHNQPRSLMSRLLFRTGVTTTDNSQGRWKEEGIDVPLYRSGGERHLSLEDVDSLSSVTDKESLLRPRGGASAFGRWTSNVASSSTLCWMVLICSMLMETLATNLSKRARDTGKLVPFLFALVLYMTAMGGFNLSLAKIDMGLAYAVWCALGSFFVTGCGILFFGESCDMTKIACLAMIITGVVGLNVRGGSH